MHEISMPALGMAPGDVYLTEWMKQPGDVVTKGDVVALVETDKAELEVEALADGVLGRHLVGVDGSAPSGSTIAWLLEPGELEPGDQGPGDAEVSPEQAAPAAGELAPGVPRADAPILQRSDRSRDPETGELEPYALSPRARAEATNTPASVTLVPVEQAPQPTMQPQQPVQPQPVQPQSDDRFRSAVANAVSQSWAQIPHFAVLRELRAEKLQAVLASFRVLDGSITFTDVLLKAYALSLVERFGSTKIDLGLAVATDRGVSIPVLTDVATSHLIAIAGMRKEAVERAREGRMNATDGRTPQSSVSNLGAYDVDSFTGIVPLGQTSLLTVGAAVERPVVENGSLAVGTTLQVTLNVDHRVWDGQHAAVVLQKLAAIAAEPGILLSLT